MAVADTGGVASPVLPEPDAALEPFRVPVASDVYVFRAAGRAAGAGLGLGIRGANLRAADHSPVAAGLVFSPGAAVLEPSRMEMGCALDDPALSDPDAPTMHGQRPQEYQICRIDHWRTQELRQRFLPTLCRRLDRLW